MTIVFTDSGLGGLSIMAEFVRRLTENPVPNPVTITKIIFYNALLQNGYGYNTMKSQSEKIHVFSRVLNAINHQFQPSIIAIACNTLSVIYPMTDYHNLQKDQVIPILITGRNIIRTYQIQYPDIPICVVATPITIQSKIYQFDDPDIIPWAADGLAGAIEADANGRQVKESIASLFQNIRQEHPALHTITLFLGCTHYGYASHVFIREAAACNIELHRILNPNSAFANHIYDLVSTPHPAHPAHPGAMPEIQVLSRAAFSENEKKNIMNFILPISTSVAGALDHYTHNPDLF